jgi:DNA-binding response OmpR family regulator
MPRVRVFQIAFDSSLLKVRAEMLKHAGLEVWSALGPDEPRRALSENADYDLVLVGWSGPATARREMVRWLKEHYAGLRVIALRNGSDQDITEADFNFCSDKPEEWFTAVKRAAAA